MNIQKEARAEDAIRASEAQLGANCLESAYSRGAARGPASRRCGHSRRPSERHPASRPGRRGCPWPRRTPTSPWHQMSGLQRGGVGKHCDREEGGAITRSCASPSPELTQGELQVLHPCCVHWDHAHARYHPVFKLGSLSNISGAKISKATSRSGQTWQPTVKHTDENTNVDDIYT